MPLSALALVLTAAVMHALWNLAAKKAQGGAHFMLLNALVSTIIYTPVVFLLLRRGDLPTTLLPWFTMTASGFIHIAYYLVLQKGYREADLSVVYPVARGSGPLLSVTIAVLLLGERPSLQALLGALLVVVGVLYLAGGPQLFRSHDPRKRAGLVWGALTGLLIATYTLVDGYSIRALGVAPLLLDYISNWVRVLAFGPGALFQREALAAEWRRTWRYAVTIGVLAPLGYILVLTALQSAPISAVAPTRELSMLVAAFLGARMLGEGEVLRRVLCAVVIGAGVALIALG